MMRRSSASLLSLLFLISISSDIFALRPFRAGQTEDNANNIPQLFNQVKNPQPKKNIINLQEKNYAPKEKTKSLRASPPLTVTNFITEPEMSFPAQNVIPGSPVGAMGTEQYVLITYDGIRSYNRNTSIADQALNTSTTGFFGQTENFVAFDGIQIRFDRFSNRWFVLGATDPFNGPLPVTIFLAISDSDVITPCTQWTISSFVVDASGTNFINEFPSLGIDSNAVYIGVNLYSTTTFDFTGSNAYVIPKNANLYGGTPDVFTFANVGTPTGGMFQPTGVDNYDSNPTFGYFVGVDVVDLSTMIIQRVINPGTAPALAPQVTITIPQYVSPIFGAPYASPYGSNITMLASLDIFENVNCVQLFPAHIRNGQLFTVQTIATDATGVSTGTPDRDAVRWYQLNLIGSDSVESPTTIPTLTYGTLYDDAASNPRFFYWPAIMTNNNGLLTIAGNVSSLTENINAFVADRAITDPTGSAGDAALLNSVQLFTNSTSTYNQFSPSNGTGIPGLDIMCGYISFTSSDPVDDANMWTVQEFVSSINNYGFQVAQLSPA
jgi:hypothetical protein